MQQGQVFELKKRAVDGPRSRACRRAGLLPNRAMTFRRSRSHVAQNQRTHRREHALRYARDPRVDAYIDCLPDWQQAVCREVRNLVHAADQEVTETIKRTDRPYFVLEGNVCALQAAKDHLNVFLYDGGIVPDPEQIITGGHDNKTARTVAIRQGEKLNAPALGAIFQQIIANNRAGGWRKLKRERRGTTAPSHSLQMPSPANPTGS